MTRVLLLSTLALAIALAAERASADSEPDARIYRLIQQGQDVRVEIAVVGSASYSVKRWGSRYERVIVDQEAMDSAPSDGATASVCAAPEPDSCAQSPDACVDCDDDGTRECPDDGWTQCLTVNRVDVTDTCVLPGKTIYTVYMGEAHDWNTLDKRGIDVADAGVACDFFPKEDATGCSVADIGAGKGWAGFAMLAIGAIALMTTRRRERGRPL
jgi:hypothetical protein